MRLESRKLGYNNVVKFSTKDGNKVLTETITDPTKIREKMASIFQNIFNKQQVDNSSESIKNFLTVDNDEEPYEELKRRALPDNTKKEMEGDLKDIELNKALMEDMKPNSAPGIDGFTVKFIRAF